VEKLRNAIRRQEHTGALALFPQPLTGMPKWKTSVTLLQRSAKAKSKPKLGLAWRRQRGRKLMFCSSRKCGFVSVCPMQEVSLKDSPARSFRRRASVARWVQLSARVPSVSWEIRHPLPDWWTHIQRHSFVAIEARLSQGYSSWMHWVSLNSMMYYH
jgi:hypothetical protein